MWLITTKGMFSAVQMLPDEHGDNENNVLVRTRRVEDMENLLAYINEHFAPEGEPARYFTDANADYFYRVYLPREWYAEFVADEVMEMSYCEHDKDHLSGDDPVRQKAYLAVWHDIIPLQREGIYSGYSGKDPYVVGLDVAQDDSISFDEAYGQDIPGKVLGDLVDAEKFETKYSDDADDADLDSLLKDVYGDDYDEDTAAEMKRALRDDR